jgi:hypothetical protein
MREDEFDRRLAAAADRLTGLADTLARGEPWSLAERFDHSPEASWGPRETLAHLEEMLPFWLGEAERILDGGDEPATFGRAATDDVRLAVIARDRTLPVRELVERIRVGIERWRRRWAELDARDRARTGRHVTLGELTVAAMADHFVAIHLEDHLEQLAAATGTATPRG